MKKYAAIAVLLASVGFNAQAEEKKDTPKGFYVVAPKSRVYIQGRAWMQFEGVQVTDRTPAAGDVVLTPRVQSLSSYLRIRGEYDLGDKWMAWTQMESEVSLDGGAVPFSDVRNSAVGLTGPYGTLQMGKWDTPFKSSTIGLDPYGGTGILGYYTVFGEMAASATGVGSNRWNSRISNSVMYTTPRFSGVQGTLMYAVPESFPSVTGTLRPYLLSAAITYNGPLYLVASYEYRKNVANDTSSATAATGILGSYVGTAAVRTTDQGLRFGAGYKYAPTFTRIGAAFEWLKAANDTTPAVAVNELTKTTFWGTITQGIMSDKHQIVFAGGFSPDYDQNGSSVADTGANYWNLGYHFNWTSDLKLYATFEQVNNKANARYVWGSQGLGSGVVTKGGQTYRTYVLGIQYLF